MTVFGLFQNCLPRPRRTKGKSDIVRRGPESQASLRLARYSTSHAPFSAHKKREYLKEYSLKIRFA